MLRESINYSRLKLGSSNIRYSVPHDIPPTDGLGPLSVDPLSVGVISALGCNESLLGGLISGFG